MTLEELLRNSETVEFRVRTLWSENDSVMGYIHPLNVNGGTIDFEVKGDTLTVIHPEPSEATILIQTCEDAAA